MSLNCLNLYNLKLFQSALVWRLYFIMNESSLIKKLHELNTEIYHVSSKWFVTDCRLLNKKEKEVIKKVSGITPSGVEIEMADGSLITIPYYPSSTPYDGKFRVVSLQKIGEPTIIRISFGDVPKEVISFSEIENKYKILREEKRKILEVAASEGIKVPISYTMEWY